MAQIQINNLNFRYPGQIDYIFNKVNLNLDTDWKLALIGRNGSGKTTLLKLLIGEYDSNGAISKNVNCEYFPYEIKDENILTIDLAHTIIPNLEEWKIYKELNLMKMNSEVLFRNFNTLSGGEKVKFLLICAFIKENRFLLIDEPTNHLDDESKNTIIEYLKSKKGFILVSHDRKLLNEAVDHILYIGKQNIYLEQGNYDSWKFNKINKDNNEIEQNEKLKKDIMKLDASVKKTENWSNIIEKRKTGVMDKGYIGHQAAKMMKRAKILEDRRDKKIQEKSNLLIDVDILPDLQMKPLVSTKNNLILVQNLSIVFERKKLFNNLSFELNVNDRMAIIGKNGTGKTSILKLIIGEDLRSNNALKVMKNIKISYISQLTDEVKGTVSKYAKNKNVDEGIFRAMLQKLGVDKNKLEKDMSDLSEGQKKKVMIARSITESAEIYIWDEPLNYLDIQSREQIENMILKYKPTMLFVEHDEIFIKKIANKIVNLDEKT